MMIENKYNKFVILGSARCESYSGEAIFDHTDNFSRILTMSKLNSKIEIVIE